MNREFEKISFEQFKNYIDDNIELYQEYNLPKRNTANSAGDVNNKKRIGGFGSTNGGEKNE